MNINYEDIITKANERAEKLKEFQAYAAHAEQHAVNVLDGLLYFSNLRHKVMALDAEGKELLGGANSRAQRIGDYASNTYEHLTRLDGTGSNQSSLMALAASLS